MATFGFIGVGNMGGALARAAARAVGSENIILANRTAEKAEVLARELGCRAADNAAAAREADFLFLGVKPQMMGDMLRDLAPVLNERSRRVVLVTMAAGLSIARIQEMALGAYPVIRIMPNTPAAIGAGMILYACGEGVTKDEEDAFTAAMREAGVLSPLPEKLIDAGCAVSGCGPAFAYLFIEALADGGVACGLPRAQAQQFAAQMVLGSAQMVLASGAHPGVLKDAVCSPGGTTIQGVRALEEKGFRGAVMDAVIAAYEKNFDLK